MVILPVPNLNLPFQDLNSNLEDKVNQACFVHSNKTNNNKDIQFDIHTNNLICDPITNGETDADHFQQYTPQKSETKAPNIAMISNTRKRKSEIAQDITAFICKLELTTTEEIVEVFTLSVKQLGLFDLFQFLRKSTKAGRKMITYATRQALWNCWHCKGFIIE